MKYLVKPRHIAKYFYSTSDGKRTRKSRQDEPEPFELLNDQEIEFEVEEVRITLPFGGVLAGKWWGDKSVRPIVCLHGWQDNAGTFDRLIPLLPRNFSYLAIDLPGHGLSSWIPDGMVYHREDYLFILNFLMEEYKWDKISLMGHSMSSILIFIYAATYPDKVDMAIGIDALKPQVYRPELLTESLSHRLDNFTVADKRNQEKSEPPSYTIDEMVEKMIEGTFDSVTRECAPYLLKRNIKRSDKYPGKFYFARDNRLKHLMPAAYGQDIVILLAKRINMPYLFLKAANSPYYERKMYHDEVVDIMKQNPNFEYHTIDAKHHLHLTDPEKCAPVISEFIKKHRRLKSKL